MRGGAGRDILVGGRGRIVMMKNRADKLVLKAFLELEVPQALRADEALAGRYGDYLRTLVNRLLMGRDERIEILTPQLLTKEDKADMNGLITRLSDGEEKREAIFYYRLAILAESVIYKYRA